MPESASRRLEWAPRALQAYLDTLAYIAAEDPRSAELVRERVRSTLGSICEYPDLGVQTAMRGERRYPIPNTGHVIIYRATRTVVRIHLWYRSKQNLRRYAALTRQFKRLLAAHPLQPTLGFRRH